jgi:hypothetical protein
MKVAAKMEERVCLSMTEAVVDLANLADPEILEILANLESLALVQRGMILKASLASLAALGNPGRLVLVLSGMTLTEDLDDLGLGQLA